MAGVNGYSTVNFIVDLFEKMLEVTQLQTFNVWALKKCPSWKQTCDKWKENSSLFWHSNAAIVSPIIVEMSSIDVSCQICEPLLINTIFIANHMCLGAWSFDAGWRAFNVKKGSKFLLFTHFAVPDFPVSKPGVVKPLANLWQIQHRNQEVHFFRETWNSFTANDNHGKIEKARLINLRSCCVKVCFFGRIKKRNEIFTSNCEGGPISWHFVINGSVSWSHYFFSFFRMHSIHCVKSFSQLCSHGDIEQKCVCMCVCM